MMNNNPAKIYIYRDLEEKIHKYLSSPEILAIVGPRQSGKTTLISNIHLKLQESNYISFEDVDVLRLFCEDIKTFANIYLKNYKYLFIDEFQYAKNGGKNLKFLFDNYKTKIIITGSSSIELGEEAIKYLTGRIFIFSLYPLSFNEFLRFKNPDLHKEVYYEKHKEFINAIKTNKKVVFNLSKVVIKEINKYLFEFVVFGGFPRVVLSNDEEEKRLILKNIFSTYILKEIKEILHIEEDFKLEKLIKAFATQIGNMFSYNELSILTGFNYNNLIKYINILEKTFICNIVRPYYQNKRVELVKTPKIFFIDNGFRNISINNLLTIENRSDVGALFENFVITELIKEGLRVNFWRTKSGAEVDVVIEENSKIKIIELKTNINKDTVGKSVYNFIEKYNPDNVYILSLEYVGKKDSIKFLPLAIV